MTSAVDLFEAELRLCGVVEGETVAVLSQTAQQRAYARVSRIDWRGIQYRRDIGYRAVARLADKGG